MQISLHELRLHLRLVHLLRVVVDEISGRLLLAQHGICWRGLHLLISANDVHVVTTERILVVLFFGLQSGSLLPRLVLFLFGGVAVDVRFLSHCFNLYQLYQFKTSST